MLLGPGLELLRRSLGQVRREEVAVRVVVGFQVARQVLQITRVEGAGGLLEAQVVEDVVVAAVVVVAHRGVQLALGVEHVDDIARTDLITDFRGFHGALVGDDRLAAGLDLFDVGVHRTVQVTGVLHHLPAQGFAALLTLAQARVGFTHLRAGQAAAVDRNVQLQADAALFDVAAVALAQGARVAETEGVVVAFLVLRHRIEGRGVAGLALLEGFLGGADRVVAGLQVEVLPGGGIDPGLGVVGRRR